MCKGIARNGYIFATVKETKRLASNIVYLQRLPNYRRKWEAAIQLRKALIE